MSGRKLFGTDGIRGKANVYPMTSEIATALGRAVTFYFQKKSNKKPLIIVGKDTRLSCYMLEQAFSAGVCSQGGEVVLTGPLPTPAIAFVTHSMRADVGVMISASHNSFEDNGIKVFDAEGFKLPDSIELELEELVLNPALMNIVEGAQIGNAKRLKEVFGRYIVHVKSCVDWHFDLSGTKIVLDCANGAAHKVAPMIFSELGAELEILGIEPNGININDQCGSLYPELTGQKILETKSDIGICLDGDADRIIVVDRFGKAVAGDRLIGLFAKFFMATGKLKKGDTVVGTLMTNLGLELYLKSIGLNLDRTDVGDRYIIENMRKNNNILGGEPSGHVIMSDFSTTGDGSLVGLKVMEVVQYFKKPVDECIADIELCPQRLINLKINKKIPFGEIEEVREIIKTVNAKLGDQGRVLLRYSGTELLARVMVEGTDEALVNSCCEDIARVVEKSLS